MKGFYLIKSGPLRIISLLINSKSTDWNVKHISKILSPLPYAVTSGVTGLVHTEGEGVIQVAYTRCGGGRDSPGNHLSILPTTEMQRERAEEYFLNKKAVEISFSLLSICIFFFQN